MSEKDDDSKGSCPEGDVVSLGPDLGGVRPYLRHREDHTLQAGFARSVQDGEPIREGAFFLRQRPGKNEYDVESLPVPDHGGGPAKVTTDAYRTGWDQIFGAKPLVGKA